MNWKSEENHVPSMNFVLLSLGFVFTLRALIDDVSALWAMRVLMKIACGFLCERLPMIGRKSISERCSSWTQFHLNQDRKRFGDCEELAESTVFMFCQVVTERGEVENWKLSKDLRHRKSRKVLGSRHLRTFAMQLRFSGSRSVVLLAHFPPYG